MNRSSVLALALTLVLAACGDDGDAVPAPCGSYCRDVCAQLVSCQLAETEGECRSACESWAASARMAAESCVAAQPLAEMSCGPLSGYAQHWRTDGWDRFPTYEGHGTLETDTCYNGLAPGVFTYTLEVSLYRGQINFYLFSEIVGDVDLSFQDVCELSADGACAWTFPYDFRNGACFTRKTDHLDFTPDGDAVTGTISIHMTYDDGSCEQAFATLPCDIVWTIQGTAAAR